VKLAHLRWLDAEVRRAGAPPALRDEAAAALRGMEDLGARLGDPAFVARYLDAVNRGWRELPRGWWGPAVAPDAALRVAKVR
jgi:hypothetical protein